MKKLAQTYRPGRIYRTRSRRFGDADLLCVKVPDTAEDGIRFINLDHVRYTGYYLSSCANDEVLMTWDHLEAYTEFKKI